ncbi:MAG: threonine synthase [Firmicutes bacterium]|nr:threonine synthase [Alicyclobacillaceae bacterium]MCL6498365.1 threonine synthase [Bacillota bacterium]
MPHTVGIVRRYQHLWQLEGIEEVITLGEGRTPLIPVHPPWHPQKGPQVWGKLEGCNPTGSFKDRGMTVAVTMAKAQGKRVALCASTGNTAASAAAYAARAGMTAVVVIPGGKVAPGKLLQVQAYGALLLEVEGAFDVALAALRRAMADQPEWELVNSVNPWRILGQESAAYEIAEDLGRAPDLLVIPVGNAGNITAYHRGFQRLGLKPPRFIGGQAAGAASMVEGRDIEHPETVASAIRIGKPVSRPYAEEAVRTTGGAFVAVSDEAILAAQAELARQGIFVEPASATPYAVLTKLWDQGALLRDPDSIIVLIFTGNGLKDADTALRNFPARRAQWDGQPLSLAALVQREVEHV